MRGRKKAFTIVELVVVIAVIAILAAVLIPTFSGMLKKANASADEQTVSLMNVAIAQRRIEGELSGEADLREAIDGVYGAGFYDRLEPVSAEDGYHFWYNLRKGEIELLQSEGVLGAQASEEGQERSAAFAESFGLRKELAEGYIFLDRGGSELAAIVRAFEEMTSGQAYADALLRVTELEKDAHDKAFASILEARLNEVAIVNDAGVFRTREATRPVFASGVRLLTAKLWIAGEQESLPLGGRNAIIENFTGEAYLPSTVEAVSSNGLYFGEGAACTVHVPSDIAIADVFAAYAATEGVRLEQGGVVYTIRGSALYCGEEAVAQLGGVPIRSFTLFAEGEPVGERMYVGADRGGVTFTAGEFYGEGGDRLEGAYALDWTAEPIEGVQIKDGALTWEQDCSAKMIEVTAKALAGEASVNVEVCLVRVTGMALAANGYAIEEGETLSLGLDTDAQYRLTAERFTYDTDGVFAEEICDTSLIFTSSDPQIAEVSEDGGLLPKSEGLVRIEVSLAAYPSVRASVSVRVVLPQAEAFERLFVWQDRYLYRIGNGNAFTVSDLFSLRDDAGEYERIGVRFYDCTGGTQKPMQAGGSLSAELLSGEGLQARYRFSGEGVAAIEAYLVRGGEETGNTRVLAEVINGQNVTDAQELGGAGETDVLLCDVTLRGSAVYAGGALYGNGFGIDVRDEEGNGGIRLQGASIDNAIVRADAAIARAVVLESGSCRLTNSCISGGKAAVWSTGASEIFIEDTAMAASCVDLAVQGRTQAVLRGITTYGDGLGVVFLEEASGSRLIAAGEWRQYNWLSEEDAALLDVTPSEAFASMRAAIVGMYGSQAFAHVFHTIDGRARLLAGLLLQGESAEVSDIRTDMSSVCYAACETAGMTLYAYSRGSQACDGEIASAGKYVYGGYAPAKQAGEAARLIFDDSFGYIPIGSEEGRYYYYAEGENAVHIGVSQGKRVLFDPLACTVLGRGGAALSFSAYIGGAPIEQAIWADLSMTGTLIVEYVAQDSAYDASGKVVSSPRFVCLTVYVEDATPPDARMEFGTGEVLYGRQGSMIAVTFRLCVDVYGQAEIVYEGAAQERVPASAETVQVRAVSAPDDPSAYRLYAYNGRTYLCGSALNAMGDYSVVVEYSFADQSGKTLTALRTFTFRADSETAVWSAFSAL